MAALTIIILMGMVLTRALMMKKAGIQAMNFGRTDKKDFLILPFAFFYFYLVFAAAFGFPTVSRQVFFSSEAISWTSYTISLHNSLSAVISFRSTYLQ
jgi:hypothetical protein